MCSLENIPCPFCSCDASLCVDGSVTHCVFILPLWTSGMFPISSSYSHVSGEDHLPPSSFGPFSGPMAPSWSDYPVGFSECFCLISFDNSSPSILLSEYWSYLLLGLLPLYFLLGYAGSSQCFRIMGVDDHRCSISNKISVLNPRAMITPSLTFPMDVGIFPIPKEDSWGFHLMWYWGKNQ